MKAQTKRTLANIFGSLVSNQRAIDGAKESPFWMGIIFGLLAAFLPVVPSMAQIAQIDGASFMNSYTMDQENAVTDTALQFLKHGQELKFLDGQLRLFNSNDEVVDLAATQPENPYVMYQHVRTFSHNPVTGKEYDTPIGIVENWTIFIDGNAGYASTVLSQNDILTSKYYDVEEDATQTPIKEVGKEQDKKYYVPSILVIYRDGIDFTIRKVGTEESYSSNYVGSTWTNTSFPKGMFHRILGETLSDDEFVSNFVSFDNLSASEIEEVQKVYSRLATVFSEASIEVKNRQFLVTTFMYLGIYAALILFMGLMVFLLTRGKNNVFNYLKFWTCMEISLWASLSPALLALILGFLMPQMAVMGFIVLEGMRIMWLCMRQLRPQ